MLKNPTYPANMARKMDFHDVAEKHKKDHGYFFKQ